MSENNDKQKTTPLHCGVVGILMGIFAGSGTALEAKLAKMASIFPLQSAGSVLMGVLGVIGLVVLVFSLRPLRLWWIVAVGYLFDIILTCALLWPIREMAISNPLALWPYILGTLTTFLSGFVVGLLAPKAPMRLASGIVSVDFVLSGVAGILLPQTLTWTLASRIIAAYCAVGVGALIGNSARYVISKDHSALGCFLGVVLKECVTATIGGILAVFFLKFLVK
ncbi:MAG: hypothetical protein PHQ35_08845 [Phycisphaerae bacterium]|nr:hypothetical protein [Phycisphaerae bacterium]MDD5381594.1 hypothetical protein [Phycisphaerae bacterium]